MKIPAKKITFLLKRDDPESESFEQDVWVIKNGFVLVDEGPSEVNSIWPSLKDYFKAANVLNREKINEANTQIDNETIVEILENDEHLLSKEDVRDVCTLIQYSFGR